MNVLLKKSLISLSTGNHGVVCLKNISRAYCVKYGVSSYRSLASLGETVVHCGIFQTTTIQGWVDAVGPNGKLIAIEADPNNYNRLAEFIHKNNLQNVFLCNAAVWSEKKIVTFQSSENSHFNKLKDSNTHSIVEHGANFTEKKVQANTLDTLLREMGVWSVDHVTLTVSGAEYHVIDGMSELLKSSGIRILARSILLDSRGKPMYLQVAEKLKKLGLHVFHGGPETDPPRDGCNVYAFR